jgi:DNA-binding IclR family transcriptional regulator
MDSTELITKDRRERTSAVGVLDRAVAILAAVERGARTLGEIVEVTGLTKTTSHRLIHALEAHGLLLEAGRGAYALGPRIVSLAATALRDLPLRELAHPSLERLARATEESAQLYVVDGDERLCVDVVESERELRTIVEIGTRLPLLKGSAGKVLLAYGSAELRDRLVPIADDPDGLASQLHTVRRRGWAGSVGEREAGVASVSAPVHGPSGELLAAVSVSGPAQRLGRDRVRRFATAVITASSEVEMLLGAERPPAVRANTYQA